MDKFIFTFFAFLLFISYGCNSGATNTTNTATNASTTNTTVAEKEPEIDVNAPFTPSANPKDDLLNSTKRLQAHESWSATLENNLYPEVKTELEFVKPDRYRIKNMATEIIVIGKDAYGKQNGKWQKLPADIGAEIEQMKKGFNAESMNAIREVKKVATEKVGDKEANVYEYSISGDKIVQNSTKVWIATASGLPLKTVVETQQTDAVARQTTVYNYDKSVKIEAPQVQ